MAEAVRAACGGRVGETDRWLLPNRDFRETSTLYVDRNLLKRLARPERFELPTPRFVV
jgi:hypothetical protein